MKTNKILAAWLATTIILSTWLVSVYANNWNWNGQWMGKNMNQEQREKVQNMSMEEKQEYMRANWIEIRQGKWGKNNWGKWNKHNPGEMLADIPSSDLSDKEKEILSYGYSEEMLARDVYNYLYELYSEEVFKKIAASEQKHMDAVQVLLDRYDLDTPTWYGDLQSTYNVLKDKGEEWLKEALEVGIQIEILDIKDIEDAILNTDNDDFKIVFTNIGWASYNHLRWFIKALDNNDLDTNIDYSDYLSTTDLDLKWPLKYKLAESLEAKWVMLPEQVTSETLKAKWSQKMDNHEKWSWKMKGDRDKKWNMNESKWNNKDIMKNNNWWNSGKYKNNSVLKNKYKNTYETKYWSVISSMSDEKLNSFISKIDLALVKVNDTNYSDTTKNKYNAILTALREIAEDNLEENEDDLDIEGLFN